MTLTTRPHPGRAKSANYNHDYHPLKDEAFAPKTYSITLEKGRFIEPWRAYYKKPYLLLEKPWFRTRPDRFASRLAFDRKSPYPPLEEWRRETIEKNALASYLNHNQFWEYREFVRHLIPRAEETWAETLDVSWWLSSTPGPGEEHIRRLHLGLVKNAL